MEELNAVARKKGWPEATVWTPVVGTGNAVVLEDEYADLASFESGNQSIAVRVRDGLGDWCYSAGLQPRLAEGFGDANLTPFIELDARARAIHPLRDSRDLGGRQAADARPRIGEVSGLGGT